MGVGRQREATYVLQILINSHQNCISHCGISKERDQNLSASARDATNISKIIKDHAKTPTTTREATTRAYFGLISETWQQQEQQQQQHVAVSGFRFRS